MFYFIQDLLQDIQGDERKQMIFAVIAVIVVIASFVAFIATIDPTPANYINL
jgi:preprotein translocase subunit SecE